MIVEVTQADIDNGVREDVHSCPIAYAITRAANADSASWVEDIAVDAYGASIVFADGGSMTLDVPLLAEQFIDDFDRGIPVGPVILDLDIRTDDRMSW